MLRGSPQPCQRGVHNSCSHRGIRSSNGRATTALRRQRTQQRQHARASASAGSSGNGSDPNPPVRGVIFDVDGVLCSSEHLSRESAAAVMKQLHGLDVAPEEFIPFGGQGEARFLGGVAEKYSVQNYDAAAAIDKFFDIYINTYTKGPAAARIAFPGAVELVRACRAAGLATAVASSAERVKVGANLSAAGFTDDDFGCVVSGASFARNKPAPDCFLAAAQGLGLPPSACVVIEDAPAGIQAARAAGMRVLGVTTTLSDEEMAAEAPDGVFTDVGRMRVEDIKGVGYSPAAAAAVMRQ